jgi:tRNA threonylcarbamoyladenosine modification (KEOPS) complex  Pcc1 subunit
MKITFDDKSFVQCKTNNNEIIIIISAKDQSNPLKKITNAVSLTKEEFKKLISDIGVV